MNPTFERALRIGTEVVAGWADLLDRINVFPVSDGDTGRNLVLTLSPLLRTGGDRAALIERTLRAARGNSGNIAAQFMSGFLEAEGPNDLSCAVARGRKLAWKAVPNPRPGTMLSLFDTLSEALQVDGSLSNEDSPDSIIEQLCAAVQATTDQLPELRKGGVVDSGALGMFLFFDGFLQTLAGKEEGFTSVLDAFEGRLEVADSWVGDDPEEGCCIDAVIEADGQVDNLASRLRSLGESVVALQHGHVVKVHLHASNISEVREKMGTMGKVVSFASDDLEAQQEEFRRTRRKPTIHILTDAAGSVTREDAARLGFTLLDSYINIGPDSTPETRLQPDRLYEALRSGVAVSTSQASTFERHQHYGNALSLHGRALYLCVGSAYTGNYETVMAWKRDHDPEDLLHVLDTGAASGRLALMALATAEASLRAQDPMEVIRTATDAISRSREYVFLAQLHFLAAGGRLSKTKAFLGDLLNKKPVVSPMPQGAQKVAVLRSRDEQMTFALARLEAETPTTGPLRILIEYTDNEEWVRSRVGGAVVRLRADATILFRPFSLTSGAHMGPGTWGLGFLPSINGETP